MHIGLGDFSVSLGSSFFVTVFFGVDGCWNLVILSLWLRLMLGLFRLLLLRLVLLLFVSGLAVLSLW